MLPNTRLTAIQPRSITASVVALAGAFYLAGNLTPEIIDFCKLLFIALRLPVEARDERWIAERRNELKGKVL